MVKRKRNSKGLFIKQTDSIVSNDIFIPNHSGISNHVEAINNLVPYNNAIKNVDLGSNFLSTSTGIISSLFQTFNDEQELRFNIGIWDEGQKDNTVGLLIESDGSSEADTTKITMKRFPVFDFDIGTSSVPFTNLHIENIDLGTNTITDGSMTGDWDYGSGNLTTTGTIKANIFDSNDLTIGDDGSDYIFDDTAATGTKRFIFKLNGVNTNASAWALWNPADNANTGMLFADGETIRFNSGIHVSVEENDAQDDSIMAFRVLHNNSLTNTGRSACFYIDGHNELLVTDYDIIGGGGLQLNRNRVSGTTSDIEINGTNSENPAGDQGQAIKFEVGETTPLNYYIGAGENGIYIDDARRAGIATAAADFQFFPNDRFHTLQDISLIDNKKILLGTDDDMEYFHNGTDGWQKAVKGHVRYNCQAGKIQIFNSDRIDNDFLIKSSSVDFAFFLNGGANTAEFGVPLDMKADLQFVGANTGLPFGEIYVQDNATVTTITTAGKANRVQINIFDTNGLFNNTTPEHTENHITGIKPGIYKVSVSMSVESAAGDGDKLGFSIYKNNGTIEFPNCHFHRDFTAGTGKTGSASMSGLIDITSTSDTIEVWGWNENDNDNFLVEDITLSLFQIGGT